jgi:hypothetical protein
MNVFESIAYCILNLLKLDLVNHTDSGPMYAQRTYFFNILSILKPNLSNHRQNQLKETGTDVQQLILARSVPKFRVLTMKKLCYDFMIIMKTRLTIPSVGIKLY